MQNDLPSNDTLTPHLNVVNMVSICVCDVAYSGLVRFPQKLRLARKRAGLSQNALAEKMGISKNTVQRWEDGTTPSPRASSLLALAEALGESPGYLEDEDPQDAIDRLGMELSRSRAEIDELKKDLLDWKSREFEATKEIHRLERELTQVKDFLTGRYVYRYDHWALCTRIIKLAGNMFSWPIPDEYNDAWGDFNVNLMDLLHVENVVIGAPPVLDSVLGKSRGSFYAFDPDMEADVKDELADILSQLKIEQKVDSDVPPEVLLKVARLAIEANYKNKKLEEELLRRVLAPDAISPDATKANGSRVVPAPGAGGDAGSQSRGTAATGWMSELLGDGGGQYESRKNPASDGIDSKPKGRDAS